MNIKQFLCLVMGLSLSMGAMAQESSRIMTTWGENLDKEYVWDVYPRPIMERSEWINLNGQWNYAVTSLQGATPTQYEGEILVPFAIESQLSGVERRLGENDA